MEPTEVPTRVVDAAGEVLKELRVRCNPAEAQIALAMVSYYLCRQYEIPISGYLSALVANSQQIENDPLLRDKVMTRLHNIGAGSLLRIV
jgi:hypothetical protein